MAISESGVELALPLVSLGGLDVGDVLTMRLFYTNNEGVDVAQIPSGPAVIGVCRFGQPDRRAGLG
ncbi:MAG: hypothetical protein IPL28_07880 [Chloroflexi bacterium]|nr:hypothetical protein [Chloroflexota bacterium]